MIRLSLRLNSSEKFKYLHKLYVSSRDHYDLYVKISMHIYWECCFILCVLYHKKAWNILLNLWPHQRAYCPKWIKLFFMTSNVLLADVHKITWACSSCVVYSSSLYTSRNVCNCPLCSRFTIIMYRSNFSLSPFIQVFFIISKRLKIHLLWDLKKLNHASK